MASKVRVVRAFRRPLAAAAVAAAACVTVVPTLTPHALPKAAAAEICKVESGNVYWGIKKSFQNYITGKIARGSWDVDQVEYESSEFVFSPASSGVEVESSNEATIPLEGSIHFHGHDDKLDMKLEDFKVVVTGDRADITVDYETYMLESMSSDAEKPADPTRESDVAIATVDLGASPDFASGQVDLSGEVTLTDDGNTLFMGAYQSNESLDPISGTLSLSCDGTQAPNDPDKKDKPAKNTKKDSGTLGTLKEINEYGTAINNILSTTDKLLTNADKLRVRFDQNGVSTNGAGPGGGPIGGATGTTGGGSAKQTTGGGTSNTGGGAAAATPGGGGASGNAGGGGAASAAGAGGASTSGGAAGGGNSVCTAEGSVGVAQASAAWGVKKSFQSYITGSIAKGSWELNGVGHDGGEFQFSGNSGAVDTKAGTGTILFPGSMFFTGHKGVLQLRISNLEIQWSGNGGSLVADVSSNNMEGVNTDFGRVALANLAFSQLSVSDSSVSGATSSVSLTEAGSQAFAEFYPVGTELDPVSFNATLGGAASCADGQGSGASGAGAAGAGGNAAAAAALKSGGSAAGGGAAGGSGAKPAGNNAAAKVNAAKGGEKSGSENSGFTSPGSFKIKSAGVDSGSGDGAGGSGVPLNTTILLILAAFVVAGATLSQFVSKNPNSR